MAFPWPPPGASMSRLGLPPPEIELPVRRGPRGREVAEDAERKVIGVVGFQPRFEIAVAVVCDKKATVRAGMGRQPAAWSARNGAIVAVAVQAAARGGGGGLAEGTAGQARGAARP